MSFVIISLHALTGADAVSGFYGHSKKVIYEKVKKVKKPNNSLQIWECMTYYLKKILRNAQCSSSISSKQIRRALQYYKQEVKNGNR